MEKVVCDIINSINEECVALDYEEDLFASGIMDSFGVVRLVTELEAKFSVEIDPEDILPENFLNISAICELLKRYKK